MKDLFGRETTYRLILKRNERVERGAGDRLFFLIFF